MTVSYKLVDFSHLVTSMNSEKFTNLNFKKYSGETFKAFK